MRAAVANAIMIVPYSTSMTIDAAAGNIVEISASDGANFAINAPANPLIGQLLVVRIRNTSGTTLGNVTWASAFKLAAWTQPGVGKSIAITFYYDGANWAENGRTGEIIL